MRRGSSYFSPPDSSSNEKSITATANAGCPAGQRQVCDRNDLISDRLTRREMERNLNQYIDFHGNAVTRRGFKLPLGERFLGALIQARIESAHQFHRGNMALAID